MFTKQTSRTMDMTQGRLLTQVLVFALPIML